MTDSARKPSFVITALLVAAGAVLWLGLWAQLGAVPVVKRRFDEFGLQLPWLTKRVIGAGNLAWANVWVAIPTALGGLVLWYLLVGWLRHRPGWTAAVTLIAALVLAANLVAATGLVLSEVKLQEGLRK